MTSAIEFPRLTHMGMLVTDVPKLRDFYTDVLGMVVTDEGEAAGNLWCFMTGDCNEHHQVVIAGGRSAGDTFPLINQISFRLGSLEALRTFYAHVKSKGVPGLEAVTHGNSWSIYFRDPDNNRIEVYAASEWYVSQPCRVPVDMCRSAEELRAQNNELTKDDPSRRPITDWKHDLAARIESSRQRL
ncbi:VOC family protein [Burkholderia pseudomultivorans]|nr:VOC family protein [Burkholderia pseudomultivorans]